MTTSIKAALGGLGALALSTLISASAAQAQRPIGMSNPAAEYCVSIGGTPVTRKDRNGGEASFCRLRGGRTVNAWTLYRRNMPQQVGSMGNPAAEHCASVGGRNVNRRDRDGGEAAYCRLRNGRTVDAWQLYRQNGRPDGESAAVTRYCTATGGTLLSNDDGTHGCRTREGDVFGAQQYYDMHHRKRSR